MCGKSLVRVTMKRYSRRSLLALMGGLGSLFGVGGTINTERSAIRKDEPESRNSFPAPRPLSSRYIVHLTEAIPVVGLYNLPT